MRLNIFFDLKYTFREVHGKQNERHVYEELTTGEALDPFFAGGYCEKHWLNNLLLEQKPRVDSQVQVVPVQVFVHTPTKLRIVTT